MNIKILTKEEIKADIKRNGVDASGSLMLAEEKDILEWIDKGEISEDAYSWWDNAQEELRCMMNEFAGC